jgi:hypothetical protein
VPPALAHGFGSTRQVVAFWVLLSAVDIKAEWLYWDWTLAALARDWGDRGDWTIYAGDPVEPVASEVVHSLRGLEADPGIRQAVAWHLLSRANEAHISQALRAAAADDERR